MKTTLLAALLALVLAGCFHTTLDGELTPAQTAYRAAGVGQVAVTVAEAAALDPAIPAEAKGYIKAAVRSVCAAARGYQEAAALGSGDDPKVLAVQLVSAAAEVSAWLARNGLGSSTGGAERSGIEWADATLQVATRALTVSLSLYLQSDAIIKEGRDPTAAELDLRVDAICAASAATGG